jgi:hypothetical protein
MFRAGPGVFHRRAEAFPEDANEDIAILYAQDDVDQSLRPFRMKARKGVCLSTGEFEPQATVPGDPVVQFLDDVRQGVALGLHVAR